MCGIAGLAGEESENESARRAVLRMASSLRHRGPDDGGIWQRADTPVVLAHRRLSIIDLSPEGAQPMASASGRYVIAYNGEIYNFPALRAELEASGAAFRGHSDTEVLLAALERWGIHETLERCNGMFAFALWDKAERRLHFARDRFGKKPLYVGWAGKQLLFASELKAFHAHGGFSAAIDRRTLALYMRYGYVPAPYAIYENVWQLLPASLLTVEPDRLVPGTDLAPFMHPYWFLPDIVARAKEHPPKAHDADVVSEFENLLRETVHDRMVADVPVGAFLSGGIDSSIITALMQQESAFPVKTYSIGFHEAGYDEASHAASVARHLQTDHHELYVGPQEAMAVIPHLAEIYDEPFADASQIPTYLVARFARQSVTVALSGDGGDEMLGGYLRHFLVPRLWSRVGWMPQAVRTGLGGMLRSLPQEKWDRVAAKYPQFGRRLHKFSELMACGGRDDVYSAQIEPWREAPMTEVMERPSLSLFDPAWKPPGLSFAEEMIYDDMLFYLPNDLMVKSDRASMAVSLETRAPLLDRRIAEYVWRLPERFKTGGDKRGKWLLRQVLARHLPADMFERPKQGFSVPLESWLSGPLQDWAHGLLDEAQLKNDGLLDPKTITGTWKAFCDGDKRHAGRLWTVLMFQSWLGRWHGSQNLLVKSA